MEEARNAGTYVCAHAYTAAAIKRCLELGVRSIEHGNVLSLEFSLSQAHVSVASHICITPQISLDVEKAPTGLRRQERNEILLLITFIFGHFLEK